MQGATRADVAQGRSDAAGPAWTDARIAEAFDARTRTVEKLRERFVSEGFESTVHGRRRERPATAKLLDGKLVDDFVFQETERIIHVGNAPSPAATASLNIGKLIVDKLADRVSS